MVMAETRQGDPQDMMKKFLVVMVAFVLLISVSTGCPVLAEGFPTGEWAFSSDPETMILQLNEDGTALYHDTAYTWEDDGQFIFLSGTDDEPICLRYLVTEKHLWLYVAASYTRKEGTAGDGIVGVWDMDGAENSFFEFTDNGRFLEDGVFDGKYQVDEDNSSFTLIYTKYFSDTVCFFRQEGEHMTIEYPWTLTKLQVEP